MYHETKTIYYNCRAVWFRIYSDILLRKLCIILMSYLRIQCNVEDGVDAGWHFDTYCRNHWHHWTNSTIQRYAFIMFEYTYISNYYYVVYQNYQYTRILLPVWYKDVNKAQYSIWRPTQKVRHLHSKYQSKCSMISLKWLAPYFRGFNSLPKLSNNIMFGLMIRNDKYIENISTIWS